MKTADLTGAELDYWVAKAEGVDAVFSDPHPDGSRTCVTYYSRDHDGHLDGRSYCPSAHWSDGGPIIDSDQIATVMLENEWRAFSVVKGSMGSGNDPDYRLFEVTPEDATASGPTPLIAAMRAYVASKFGDEVPKERD